MFCDSAYFYYSNETVESCTRARDSSCSDIQSEKRAEGESAFSFYPPFCLICLRLSVTVGWIDSQSKSSFPHSWDKTMVDTDDLHEISRNLLLFLTVLFPPLLTLTSKKT